ncbi:MAG TPA: hypothetical protein PLL86_20230, partial [Leptospiraceae bacterium]|nr:hypothetical protein [Leptospiraceae bacterium]
MFGRLRFYLRFMARFKSSNAANQNNVSMSNDKKLGSFDKPKRGKFKFAPHVSKLFTGFFGHSFSRGSKRSNQQNLFRNILVGSNSNPMSVYWSLIHSKLCAQRLILSKILLVLLTY